MRDRALYKKAWILLQLFAVVFTLLCIVYLAGMFVFLHFEDRISRRFDWSPAVISRLLDPLSVVLKEVRRERNDLEIWGIVERDAVFGYTDRHSITPGESFRIMLATGPRSREVRGHVEIYRIGFYGESDRKKVWSSSPLEVGRGKVFETSASVGLMWPAAVSRIPTDSWVSGYYDIDFVNREGKRFENVAFMVVTDPAKSGDVLVKLGTNTYQAYNDWGGHSLYKKNSIRRRRGHVVSFDRPMAGSNRHRFFRWEYGYVVWLERLAKEHDFAVHYATNFDVASDPALAENYRLLISVGHDEYWTMEEFQNTYRRIFELGKNTLFLGANTAYWQVRFTDLNAPDGAPNAGRQLLSFKSTADPIRHRLLENEVNRYVTARFRDQARFPETMLLGVAYDCNTMSESRFPYYVKDTQLPFFQNTAYEAGELVGEIVGHEWDNRDPDGDGNRLYQSDGSYIALLPEELIHTVLVAETVCSTNGKPSHAEAVYFDSPAGGKVFSSGTNDWAHGLAMPGHKGAKFRKLNENLVLQFLDLPGK